jgi:predicted nuclease of predicted toxin-antitoxin system
MKLLLDENLSRRIIPMIQDAYPESSQIALLGMESANDKAVWAYAQQQGFILVTQDSDFNEMSVLYGHPPKIIWLKCGNQPRKRIVEILLSIQEDVTAFATNPTISCLEVYG